MKIKEVTWSRDLECFYYIIYWRRWSWRTWSFYWQVAETGLGFMGFYEAFFARPAWLRKSGRVKNWRPRNHMDWKKERLIRKFMRQKEAA